jgi:hypothetical protein
VLHPSQHDGNNRRQIDKIKPHSAAHVPMRGA